MIRKLERRINRWKFKHSVRKLKGTEFCIVANSCLGSRLYKILGRQYNTPFVGLLIKPPCFAKLVSDFEGYMSKDLAFTAKSKYPNHPNARRRDTPCPIGLLGDVELQFIHYGSEEEAAQKWNRRKERMIASKLYFILVIDEPGDNDVIPQYIASPPANKVCFQMDKELTKPACVYIPSQKPTMGNLYSQFHRFVGHFDFAEWIRSSQK